MIADRFGCGRRFALRLSRAGAPRRPVLAAVLFALLATVPAASAQAAPGDLDRSFSGDGKQTTELGRNDEARAVAVQPDGKIVVVGESLPAPSEEFASDFEVVRYNPDGSLDQTFGKGGRQTTDFGAFDQARGVELDPGGRIVVVGTTYGAGSGDFAIARYTAAGDLDTSFGKGGKQTTDFGANEVGTSLALTPAGQIVVVGLTDRQLPSGQVWESALARYDENGSLDNSFDQDGKQTTGIGADGKQTTGFGGFSDARGVAVQPDGKIVTTGLSRTGTASYAFTLARYNPGDGSLDRTFGGDGIETTKFGSGLDSADADPVLLGDGKIVAGGTSWQGRDKDYDFALARYNHDGSLDSSFAGDGKQTTDFGDYDDVFGSGLVLQGDGKLVLGGRTDARAPGSSTLAPKGDFALARYTADGSLDRSFAGDGKQTTDFGKTELAAGLALAPGDKIVAAGTTGIHSRTGNYNAYDFAIARYDQRGNPRTVPPPGGGSNPAPPVGKPPAGAQPAAGGCPAGNSPGVTCQPLPGGGRQITGTAGNDKLVGTAGNDVIRGGAGNDTIDAGAGNDNVDAGAGNDSVVAGTGSDRAVGGSGDDVIHGNEGNDRLGGQSGRDRLSGNEGNDVLNGEAGNDRMAGNSGRDRMSGGRGNDRGSGGSGNDRMRGGSGNDNLSGNSGNDTLIGDSGRDRLAGNSGRDRLFGGSGNDSLRGGSGRDRLNGGPGRDRARQ